MTRTLKRDVHEGRVLRVPYAIRASMSGCESDFYVQVTEAVREYCEVNDVSTGFMLTIPQRQMSSCMAAACRAWQKKHATLEAEELEETLYDLQGDLLEEASPQADDMGLFSLPWSRSLAMWGTSRPLEVTIASMSRY